MTIREAAEKWVKEMNAFPKPMILKLYEADPDDWREVTTPSCGDRVYSYDEYEFGEIVNIKYPFDDCDDKAEDDYNEEEENEDEDESCDEILYKIELDNGKTIFAKAEDIEFENYDFSPMWGTMWSFGDSIDDYWLEEDDGIRLMSECGFRIYVSDSFGYFFGIDGAGYDFYESHWIPLYKARGLQWHDPQTENGSYAISD